MEITRLNSKKPHLFILFGIVICLVILTVENINGRFHLNDFKVYYSAAVSLLEGGQVYGKPFGLATGYYKYSPFSLLFFVPYTMASFEVARVFHFLVLVVVAISAVILIKRIIGGYFFETEKRNAPLIITFICILIHLVRELHLGNINVVLVLLTSLGVLAAVRQRHFLAGLLLGAVIITKPYFLLLLLPLAAHRKFKTLAALFLFIVVFLLAPAAFLGFAANVRLHQEWVSAMFAHGDYLESSNTVEYLIQYYIYPQGQNIEAYGVVSAAVLYAVFFWFNRHAVRKAETPDLFSQQAYILESFILVALIPNLVITDTEHFLYTLPLIALLVCYLFERKSLVLSICFAVLIFFYGGNSSDLLGEKLAARFDELGVLGISSLLLIAAVIYLYVRERGRWRANAAG